MNIQIIKTDITLSNSLGPINIIFPDRSFRNNMTRKINVFDFVLFHLGDCCPHTDEIFLQSIVTFTKAFVGKKQCDKGIELIKPWGFFKDGFH